MLDFGPAERPVDALFLHANGFNALTYRTILAPLADRFRIIAFDQRGHGGTSLATEPEARTNWLDMRDDLLAFAAAEDLSQVVLAGHSMGATASVLAAAQEPALARRLVLFDPVMAPEQTVHAAADSPLLAAALKRRDVFPSRAAALARYLGRGAFRSWPDVMVEDYVAAGFRDTPDGDVTLACAPSWEASNYAAHAHDSFGALAAVAATTDIFAAEQGSTLRAPPDIGWPQAFPHVHLRTVAGASHFLPMERPELAREAISGAIEGG